MAVARFIQTNIGADVYDQMRERLGIGDTPPPGGAFHVAAIDADGTVRIVEVWDSQEQAEAWGAKVEAARAEAGLTAAPPSVEYLEVHSIVQR